MSRGGDVYSKVVETFEGGHVTSFVVSHYLPRMFMLIPLSSKREREKLREQRMREREGKGNGVGRWLDLEVNPLSILLVLRIRRQEKLRQLTEAEEVRHRNGGETECQNHIVFFVSQKKNNE